MDALVERLETLEQTVKELKQELRSCRGYVLKVVLKNSGDIVGYRRLVYVYAELDCGFYTCEDPNMSIGYVGDDDKNLTLDSPTSFASSLSNPSTKTC